MPSPAPNFNLIARAYRWLEYFAFGPLLMRARLALLPRVTHSQHALVLGDGDGRFLARLLAASPSLRALAVDASPAMLDLLSRRCNSVRVTTQVADIRTFTPDPTARFDLIVTHFFLDCLTTDEISELATRLAPHLSPRCRWLISDFTLPASPLLRPFAQILINTLYRTFGLLTGLRISHLPDHAFALTQAGWHRIEQRTLTLGLLTAELWEFQPR